MMYVVLSSVTAGICISEEKTFEEKKATLMAHIVDECTV